MSDLKPCDSEHDFTLVLSCDPEHEDEAVEALFGAGCDDATPALRYGKLYLSFSRSSPSFEDAVLSAITDVRKSGANVKVLRVDDCYLVTQANIARRIKRPRQVVHQYISGIRGPGRFPGPACYITEKVPLWYWCEVAYWLVDNNLLSQEELDEANFVDVLNSHLELERQKELNPELTSMISEKLSG